MALTSIQMRNQTFTTQYLKNISKSNNDGKISARTVSTNNVDSYIPSKNMNSYGNNYSPHALAMSVKNRFACNNTYYCPIKPSNVANEYSQEDRFWIFMAQRDPVYLGLEHSYDDARKYLDEAGIQKGFFSVKLGDREYTHYYTSSKNCSPIQAKYKYDNNFQELTSGGHMLSNYEPGDVFKIGDKKYTLSENHTLDLAYGDDVFSLEYPANYKFGSKVGPQIKE